MEEIKVLGLWASPYSYRVTKALKMKGIEFEFVEEDLQKKSQQLLELNPVHKKVPVLVHAGKPIAESSVILEYIDEMWKDKGSPLFPSHPYHRAQVRFWANFIDQQVIPAVRTALMGQGEEARKASEEAEGYLKILENEIKSGNKLFQLGEEIGYLELVGVTLAYWPPILQQVTGKELITTDKYPNIWGWSQRLLDFTHIQQDLPPKDQLAAFFKAFLAFLHSDSPKP